MIKYINWSEHLRQGNFLFLWLSIHYIAKKSGNKVVLPSWYMWKYMNFEQEITDNKDFEELFHFRQTNYTPEEFQFLVNFFTENKDKVININLGSHCQSELFWGKDIEFAKSLLTIKQEYINNVKEKYSYIFNGRKTIGIGLRMGDFEGHGCFFQIDKKWYIKALEGEFPDWKDCNVVFFSDDINTVKTLYKADNFYYAEANNTHLHTDGFKHYRNDPMDQFILGTLMDNFIGGSSTFTWFQMYYVKNFNNGKVVHSNRNLRGECLEKFYNPNYYPENWTNGEKYL